jgi:hypothetical protein
MTPPSCLLARLAGAALSIAALTGCSGLEPGDYIVYRIAFQQPQLEAECFAAGAVPVNQQDDSSSVFTAGTFILFMGADETPYLDTGVSVLSGEGSDDEYAFSGSFVDVNYQGPMDEVKQTSANTTDIDMAVDGETVSGTVHQIESFDCTSSDPTMCPDPPSTRCTSTTPFSGGEVEDVDLKHEV